MSVRGFLLPLAPAYGASWVVCLVVLRAVFGAPSHRLFATRQTTVLTVAACSLGALDALIVGYFLHRTPLLVVAPCLVLLAQWTGSRDRHLREIVENPITRRLGLGLPWALSQLQVACDDHRGEWVQKTRRRLGDAAGTSEPCVLFPRVQQQLEDWLTARTDQDERLAELTGVTKEFTEALRQRQDAQQQLQRYEARAQGWRRPGRSARESPDATEQQLRDHIGVAQRRQRDALLGLLRRAYNWGAEAALDKAD